MKTHFFPVIWSFINHIIDGGIKSAIVQFLTKPNKRRKITQIKQDKMPNRYQTRKKERKNGQNPNILNLHVL